MCLNIPGTTVRGTDIRSCRHRRAQLDVICKWASKGRGRPGPDADSTQQVRSFIIDYYNFITKLRIVEIDDILVMVVAVVAVVVDILVSVVVSHRSHC